MKLTLTMNMPAHKGGSVHQIICEHPCATLEEFRREISEQDFITVKEYYHVSDGKMKEAGDIVVNCLYIGKVKATKFTP